MNSKTGVFATLGLVATALAFVAFPADVATAGPSVASLSGEYDGHQMEIAAGLRLKPDGRFEYALSYGGLDEEAEGSWKIAGGAVVLTSDPVTPARFVLVSRGKGDDGVLRVDLDGPEGIERQYFDAVVTTADGKSDSRQLAEDGLSWPFAAGAAPTSVRVVFGMYSLASEPAPLDAAGGYAVRFRFEPNDLGKVAFNATPLKIVNGALVLERYDRTISFKRLKR